MYVKSEGRNRGREVKDICKKREKETERKTNRKER